MTRDVARGGRAVKRPGPRTAKPRRVDDLQVVPLDDGYLAFRRQADRVHRLNASAALVLELCDGEHSATRIAALVAEAYRLRESPLPGVRAILRQMATLGLIAGIPAASPGRRPARRASPPARAAARTPSRQHRAR